MINLKTVAFVGQTPVPVEMIYEGYDPYTIEFVFHHAGNEIHWLFSKELLDGLSDNDHTGEGDVMFELDEQAHILAMAVCSNDGFALLEFDPCAVDEFLEEVDFSPEFAHAELAITDDEIYGWLGTAG